MRRERLRACAALLLCFAGGLATGLASGQSVRVLVQASPLAGFQYHAGAELWHELKVGDALRLVREPDNAFDANAIRMEWHGRHIGYLPRAQNREVAAQMDAGARVEARIARLRAHRNPWQRILVEVFVVL